MKRIIYTLLAATISLSACQKENRLSTAANNESVSITDEDFENSKASIVGSNKKNTDYGLELDYDLVIKEVSDDKYKVAIKMHGLKLNGQKLAGNKNNSFKNAIFGIVVSINNAKEKQDVPLDLKLTNNDVNGDTYNFPEFTFKGDLTYELVNVKASFKIKDGSLQIKDKTTITLGGSDITIQGGDIIFNNNSSVNIKEGTDITINNAKTETNFALLLGSSMGDKSSCDDDDDYFVLPKGHTIEQNPEVSKVTFPKNEKGERILMRITVTGDPAQNITNVYYTPAPIADPKNPGSTIQPPAIEFEASKTNKKNGWKCYDHCLSNDSTSQLCGYTGHFKPADFNQFGEGWARITLKSEL